MNDDNKFYKLKYKIIRKKKKNISIKVDESGNVIVSSPFGVSRDTIDYIVNNKRYWIINRINITKKASKNFNNGEQLLYLGQEKSLNIIQNPGNDHVEISEDNITVFVSSKERDHVIEALKNFYVNKARTIFKERTKLYGKKINKFPNKIFIKDQKTIWGSCSSIGNVNYNYRIIMAPIEIVDYIVVHELCHMIHMNHSISYWNLVESVMPDYKVRREWLKKNGRLLNL